jgi:hypothetical protein
MSLIFPLLVSSDTKLNSYCNYIEYCTFCNGDIFFDEFDTDESGLQQDDVIAELGRRLVLYGTAFIPYVIRRDKVESLIADKDNYLHYFYCLYYAVKGGNSSAFNTNIFEQITDNSLKNYFGTTNSTITSIGQSTSNLKGSIEAIRVSLMEVKGSYDDIRPQAKDGGIDIVTFKPLDNRGNQIVCLTDATIGKNWRDQKQVVTKLRYWQDYIHFKVCPVTCLSIVHIVDEADFYQASRDNGLIFDRARIMKYFTSDNTVKTTLTAWHATL